MNIQESTIEIEQALSDLIKKRNTEIGKQYTESDYRFDASLMFVQNILLNHGKIQIIISKSGGVESIALIRDNGNHLEEVDLKYGMNGTLKDALRAGFEELLMKL